MSALANSATGRTYISGSKYYNQYIKEDTMCIAKMAVGFAGLDSAAYSSMAGVAAESTAMTAVAASSTAMTAVAASGVARSAIEASSTAINVLSGSSKKTTYSDTSASWDTKKITGKGFVFTAKDDQSTSGGYITVDGSKTMVENGSQKTINKFYTSNWEAYLYKGKVVYLPIS